MTTGTLERLYPGVFRLTAARETWEQRAMGVLLWLGQKAALSHRSAAHLLGFDGFERRPDTIDVLVPYLVVNEKRALRCDPRRRVAIHTTRGSFTTVVVRGLRVTVPARTLMDLAGGEAPKDVLDDALDSAQRKWPWAAQRLRATLQQCGKGRPGARRLGRLLAERGGASTDSPLEARVFRALRRAGLPRPVPQLEVRDGDGYVVRLDFAWPEERVALHVDGYAFHHQRRQFERDRTVANRLAALGWCSTWVTHRSLDDDRWLGALREVLSERAPQLRLI